MATGHGQFFVRERPRATFHRRSITNAPAPLCAAPASPKLGDELQRRRHGQRVEKASTASPAGRGEMGVSGVGSGSKRRGGGGWLAAAWHSPGECQNISCGRSCRQRAPKNDLWGPSGPPEHRQEVHPAHAGQGKRGSPGIVGRLEALNHRPDAPRTPREANIPDSPSVQLRTGTPNAWSRSGAGERHLAASASRRRCGRRSRVVGRPATAINGSPLRSHSKRQ